MWYNFVVNKYIIGIDEVGRGPVAGPLVMCGACMPVNVYEKLKGTDELPKTDSKKMSAKKRNEWFENFKAMQKSGDLNVCIVSAPANEIDKSGISACLKKGVKDILEKLGAETETKILLDGSLSAPVEYVNVDVIIKGDEKEPIIGTASIIAKVSRDSYMQKMHEKYPEYGFDTHVGYGTKKHLDFIKKSGPTPLHRKSFLKNYI